MKTPSSKTHSLKRENAEPKEGGWEPKLNQIMSVRCRMCKDDIVSLNDVVNDVVTPEACLGLGIPPPE